jgi:hypothetical protein
VVVRLLGGAADRIWTIETAPDVTLMVAARALPKPNFKRDFDRFDQPKGCPSNE